MTDTDIGNNRTGEAADVDLAEFAKQVFKAAQSSAAWLSSAERLRDAAEAIREHEHPNEIRFVEAYADASQKATTEAYSEGNDSGVAEIKAVPPNYPPAQLLYAYAIENALKGLVIASKSER
jgi:hypothetical protein